MRLERLKNDSFLDVLRMMAPGTSLREGLENILKAKTGALIVIGDSPEVIKIVDGGFTINKPYTSSHLYELAKMDGAIVVSKDLKVILYANALLIPDASIVTTETGTRHKTAERFAKQTGEIVLCISQRRNVITLYKDNRKYILRDTSTILTRANQALQTLEKYKSVLDAAIKNLNVLELEDIVTLNDVAYVIQRTEMVMRIVDEIDRYICELGNEGRLSSMQLEELLQNVENNVWLVIEDYQIRKDGQNTNDIVKQLRNLSNDELVDLASVAKLLGFSGAAVSLDTAVSPRGYRMLSRLPKLPVSIMRNIIGEFQNLQGVIKASIEDLDKVEGIGEVRAKSINEGLSRIKEQTIMDKRSIY